MSFAEHRVDVKNLTLQSLSQLQSTVCIEDLTRRDALSWIAALRSSGNEPTTLFNRANNLNIFVRHFGLPALLIKKDKPKYTQKKVRAYNDVELAQMLEAATEDEAALLLYFAWIAYRKLQKRRRAR